MKSYQLARRDLIAAGGLGLGIGLAAGIPSAKAQTAARAQLAQGTIWSQLASAALSIDAGYRALAETEQAGKHNTGKRERKASA